MAVCTRCGAMIDEAVIGVHKCLDEDTPKAKEERRVVQVKPDRTTNLPGFSIPGLTIDKLEITKKGKGVSRGNIEILDATKGLVLTSPNGKRFMLIVDDTGVLTTVEVV